jgi:phage-related protein
MGRDKPLRWQIGSLQTPPVGRAARVRAGVLLRRLQRGEALGLPHSRPMPSIGPRVHELRVNDGERRVAWRIVYRIDEDAIIVIHWFEKKTERTPDPILTLCRLRLREYDNGH